MASAPTEPNPDDPVRPVPADEVADQASELAAASEPHDPTGLELARKIAAQVGAQSQQGRRRRRRPRPSVNERSGARPDDRDPQLLGQAFDSFVADRGWNTQVSVHLMLANWPKLVGPINADHSTPEAFADGVLTIRASSTSWATQLRLFAPQLVAKLNADLGDGSVSKIVVKGPDAPSWKHGRRSVPGRGPRDTYG